MCKEILRRYQDGEITFEDFCRKMDLVLDTLLEENKEILKRMKDEKSF